METTHKHSDENYDRRAKGADEIFCGSCGAIIKAEAEICPKCGVKNKAKVVNDVENNRASMTDGTVVERGSAGWLIFWILVFWPIAILYYMGRKWK